jgi:mRNA-degrading endonuclease RelE of RelBE toxin-antitoxin system
LPPYKVLVSIEILQLERPSRRQRDQILRFLQILADDPTKPGDYEERDDIGRPIQIKIVGDFALTYWADHAVREVKVIQIEKADRLLP